MGTKNIWDNVYYRLNDPTEIQLAILYVMRYVGRPVSDIELKHFMLSATSVEFLDLLEQLGELEKQNHVKIVLRDELEHYDFTASGAEMIDIFEDKIMVSVRESIKTCVDEYYHRKAIEEQIKAKLVPVDYHTYMLQMCIKEGKNVILDMSIFAGDRERAIELKKKFEADPIGFYSKVNELLEQNQSEE